MTAHAGAVASTAGEPESSCPKGRPECLTQLLRQVVQKPPTLAGVQFAPQGSAEPSGVACVGVELQVVAPQLDVIEVGGRRSGTGAVDQVLAGVAGDDASIPPTTLRAVMTDHGCGRVRSVGRLAQRSAVVRSGSGAAASREREDRHHSAGRERATPLQTDWQAFVHASDVGEEHGEMCRVQGMCRVLRRFEINGWHLNVEPF